MVCGEVPIFGSCAGYKGAWCLLTSSSGTPPSVVGRGGGMGLHPPYSRFSYLLYETLSDRTVMYQIQVKVGWPVPPQDYLSTIRPFSGLDSIPPPLPGWSKRVNCTIISELPSDISTAYGMDKIYFRDSTKRILYKHQISLSKPGQTVHKRHRCTERQKYSKLETESRDRKETVNI